MDETFRVYVDQLREGEELAIAENAQPSFLAVEERDLRFTEPVAFSGVAYIAGDDLLLNLRVSTQVLVPCTICNEWVSVPLVLENLYMTKSSAEIKGGVYDFREALREEILLQVPQFAECNNGDCPQRRELAKYLKSSNDEEDTYHPFEGL